MRRKTGKENSVRILETENRVLHWVTISPSTSKKSVATEQGIWHEML